MSWQPKVDELRTRRNIAMQMVREETAEGGIMASYIQEEDPGGGELPEERRLELEQAFEPYRSPFRTAEAFDVEEIIDPRETRPILCEFVRGAQELTRTQLGPKWRLGVRP